MHKITLIPSYDLTPEIISLQRATQFLKNAARDRFDDPEMNEIIDAAQEEAAELIWNGLHSFDEEFDTAPLECPDCEETINDNGTLDIIWCPRCEF